METIKQNFKFSLKIVASLVAICVLIPVFTLASEAKDCSPSLTITKSVDKTFISPGDDIFYTLSYQNNGSGKATGVIIKDPFTNLNQHYLTLISASPIPDSNNAWIIGSLEPGQSDQIHIRAKLSESIPSWASEIKNRASIESNETSLKYSNYVSVFTTVRTLLNINKLVRNVSKNSRFAEMISADPGDEIEFSLEISATGNGKVENTKVWDNLSGHLDYVSGTTTLDGSSYGDEVTEGGIDIGSLSGGQTKTIKFRAKLESEDEFSFGTTILSNYGYVLGQGLYTIFDTATIKVERGFEKKNNGSLTVIIPTTSQKLNVDKLVRNITAGSKYTYWQTWTNVIYAEPGDELEFLIKIYTIGSEGIDSVRVEDKLPSKLTYISDSTTVDGTHEPDGITTKNIYIGEVDPYLIREIKFKAKVAPASQFSLYPITLKNIVYAWGSDGEKIKDYAEVKVREGEGEITQELSINKLGRNISQDKDIPISSFSAKPNEEIEFSMQVTNIGNSDLNNVKVWDILPAHLFLVTGSITVDGNTWSGNIVAPGILLGTLKQGQSKTIKFRAKIASEDKFSPGSTTLINTAYANATNVPTISDQASVMVSKEGEVLGAATVATGGNLIALVILIVISGFIAFVVYCRVREGKLLEVLNSDKTNRIGKTLAKLYFKTKFFFTLKGLRYKKFYW